MNIADKFMTPEFAQAMKDDVRDGLNKEYDFYKRMLHALAHNMDFVAVTKIDAVSQDKSLRENYLKLEREELILILQRRRELVHVQLNSLQQLGAPGSN